VGNIRFLFESDIPCAIFTHDLDPSPELSMIAKDTGTPVLQTDLPTSEFSARLMRALSNIRQDHHHPRRPG
jgi:HPr kinase/phosphorylase